MIRITEFADSRKEVERSLVTHLDVIIEHLLCLILDPSNSCREHWITEIYAFLSSVKKLSYNNKFPTPDNIYKWTYGKVQDCVTDHGWLSTMIEDVSDKENIVVTKPLEEIMRSLDSVCVEYFSWLSDRLSVVGRVTRMSVINKVNELVPI